jgi:hypothetical protein
MDPITLLGKWQTCISCMAVPMEILRNHVAYTQNIIHNAESHPRNYSPDFTDDWANLGPLLHGCQIMKGLDQFELPIWKFAYWEEWKKILEPVCKEWHLLKVSMFPLSGEFLWTFILPIPHIASASLQSSRPLCKGGVLLVASSKMGCKLTVCSWHPVYCWGRIHKGWYREL